MRGCLIWEHKEGRQEGRTANSNSSPRRPDPTSQKFRQRKKLTLMSLSTGVRACLKRLATIGVCKSQQIVLGLHRLPQRRPLSLVLDTCVMTLPA